MIKSVLKDGIGTGRLAKVTKTNVTGEHALCINISGSSRGLYVPTGPAVSGDRFDETLKDNGSEDMNIDGSVTPVNFRIEADATKDLILTELLFFGIDSIVRIEGFFGIVSPLTNGVVLEVQSDGILTTFRPIKKTSDFELFSTLGGYTRENETGGNSLKAIRQFPPAFPIRKAGTFGPDSQDDYVQVTINDDLTSITNFLAFVRGLKYEAGAL